MACSDGKKGFTEDDLPDLTGYVAIVTGGALSLRSGCATLN